VSTSCEVPSASLNLNHCVVSRKRLKRSNLPLLGAIFLLYVMAVIHLANRASIVRNAFVNHGDNSIDTIIFLLTPNNLTILSDVAYFSMPVLADCILVRSFVCVLRHYKLMSFIDMESLCYLGWQSVGDDSSYSFDAHRTG
jgi:hypothetical protein